MVRMAHHRERRGHDGAEQPDENDGEPERLIEPVVDPLAGKREERRGRQAEGKEPLLAQERAERAAVLGFLAPFWR